MTVSGWLSIVVSGAVVSGPAGVYVHVWLAGDGSTLPAKSIERTTNVCAPGVRPLIVRGLVHGVHAGAPTGSRAHS